MSAVPKVDAQPGIVPKLAKLGHIGIHVADLERAVDFYTRVLNLTITDEDRERGMVFLSARPEEEHHEILLCKGLDVPAGSRWLQQVSCSVRTIDELKAFHERLLQEGVPIIETVTHGYALGIYFRDPDGNRLEIYWHTGWKVKQPYKRPIDFTLPADQLIERARAMALETNPEAFA